MTGPTPTRRRIVGTAGHIDHGKTALVKALTGIDCDRLPEEKQRGITIDLGFANLRSGALQIGFIDVPGHERFVKNMLAGVGGIDSVLLVVAADESVMPQTREHFEICELLRLREGVIAITKSDLVDDDSLEVVRLEIEDLVHGSFLEGKPIIPVSSIDGRGIRDLETALLASVSSVPDRDATSRLFRLPIDRAFTMKGFGSVITGTTISGTLDRDLEVEVLPLGRRSRARDIQVHGESRERAIAGERTSINLPDIPLEQLRRGEQVVLPDTLRPSQILTAELEILPGAGPLKDQTRLRFHHYASELLGSVRILTGTARQIDPGSRAFVQIRLESPVVAAAGDRFVARRYSPATTIAGGVILDPHLPRLRRGTREEVFDRLASGDLVEQATEMIRLTGISGLTVNDLAARTGYRADRILASLGSNDSVSILRVESRPVRWIHMDHVASFRRKAMAFFSEYFRENRMSLGVPKGQIVQKLLPPTTDPLVVSRLLGDLEREKILVINGDVVDVPGRSKDPAGTEGELGRLLEKRFRESGLNPPPVSQLIREIPQKPKVIEGVIGFLVGRGMLVRLAEGIYIHRDVLEEAKSKVARHRGESVDVAWFKDLFGITRKVVIPLLEHLDQAGVTKRKGDRREVL